MDFLAKYCADMPKDYKQILEERKMDVVEQEFELKKKMYDLESGSKEDDGFMEALAKSAKKVWEDEEKSEEKE